MHKNIIERERLSVRESYCYPVDIVGTYNCHWRALYNVILDEKIFSSIYKQIQRKLSGPDEIRRAFDHFPTKDGGKIFHLKGHHWVSLTKEYYTDDAYRYEVIDYTKAVQELSKWENI